MKVYLRAPAVLRRAIVVAGLLVLSVAARSPTAPIASAPTATPATSMVPAQWPIAQSTADVWRSPLILPTDPPPPTVDDAKAWALSYLGPREYAALDHIVWYESKWRPDAVNSRSGACGLGQFWPCSKMSATLSDWPVRPLEQLRDYVIPYARRKHGSLEAGWAYECAHGRW